MILENKFACEKVDNQEVLVEGIRKAVEKEPVLYRRFEKILRALFESDDPEVREALLKAFRRFHRLGIVDGSKLAELHIAVPQLAGPFSKNLKFITELPDIQRMAASIKADPELSRLIYPTVLVGGSRLKGYGRQDADLDIAVFVRPKTPFGIQPRLRELLPKTFAHERIYGDEIVELWLEEKGDKFKICELSGNAFTRGSSWADVLSGTAWIGSKECVLELSRKLLVPYMMDCDRETRSLYLEQMERSSLQYRLLHNGYERFFPPYGGINVPYSDAIDGKSMFWDSGYRQLATRLFVNWVFLPKV